MNYPGNKAQEIKRTDVGAVSSTEAVGRAKYTNRGLRSAGEKVPAKAEQPRLAIRGACCKAGQRTKQGARSKREKNIRTGPGESAIAAARSVPRLGLMWGRRVTARGPKHGRPDKEHRNRALHVLARRGWDAQGRRKRLAPPVRLSVKRVKSFRIDWNFFANAREPWRPPRNIEGVPHLWGALLPGEGPRLAGKG